MIHIYRCHRQLELHKVLGSFLYLEMIDLIKQYDMSSSLEFLYERHLPRFSSFPLPSALITHPKLDLRVHFCQLLVYKPLSHQTWGFYESVNSPANTDWYDYLEKRLHKIIGQKNKCLCGLRTYSQESTTLKTGDEIVLSFSHGIVSGIIYKETAMGLVGLRETWVIFLEDWFENPSCVEMQKVFGCQIYDA
jgi:hypothetical protein